MAKNAEKRFKEHCGGYGAKLTSVIKDNGIEMKLNIIKEYSNYSEAHKAEKKLKNTHSA